MFLQFDVASEGLESVRKFTEANRMFFEVIKMNSPGGNPFCCVSLYTKAEMISFAEFYFGKD